MWWLSPELLLSEVILLLCALGLSLIWLRSGVATVCVLAGLGGYALLRSQPPDPMWASYERAEPQLLRWMARSSGGFQDFGFLSGVLDSSYFLSLKARVWWSDGGVHIEHPGVWIVPALREWVDQRDGDSAPIVVWTVVTPELCALKLKHVRWQDPFDAQLSDCASTEPLESAPRPALEVAFAPLPKEFELRFSAELEPETPALARCDGRVSLDRLKTPLGLTQNSRSQATLRSRYVVCDLKSTRWPDARLFKDLTRTPTLARLNAFQEMGL